MLNKSAQDHTEKYDEIEMELNPFYQQEVGIISPTTVPMTMY
jgi:hypothetical protein